MTIEPWQLRTAARIDERTRELERAGGNDVTILRDMADLMPDFKRLMDACSPEGMDELCSRLPGFYRYAKILEKIAAALSAGVLKEGRDF